MNNIAHSFVQLGQYHDAIQSYESIMEGSPDFQTGYNLILCYYALGDTEKMKKGFIKLLSIEIPGEEDEEDENPNFANDTLAEYIKEKRREAFKYISDVAKLIANLIEDDWEQGYDWILEQLQAADFQVVESDIEIHKALQYMKNKNFDKAIEVFKSFEKKDRIMMARASTNISFLYFIEKGWSNAEKYADVAIKNDRYNAKALVNKGNCLFMYEDFEKAKEYYLEAIGVEADCVEAIYNLGLVNRHIGQDIEALQAFEKLQTILSSSPEVMFQMAAIYERVGDPEQAMKWYNILSTKLNSDPGILLRIGQLYSNEGDESQAFHYYNESYRHLPTIESISWLGVFYVKNEFYEKAVTFFERATEIQPDEVKWKLMVASCHRRMSNYNKAIALYEEINEAYPDNVDCLQYLVSICKETGQRYDHYNAQLIKIQRQMEMDNPGGMQGYEEPTMSYQQTAQIPAAAPAYNPPLQQAPTQQAAPQNLQMRPGSSRRDGRQMPLPASDDADWANTELGVELLP